MPNAPFVHFNPFDMNDYRAIQFWGTALLVVAVIYFAFIVWALSVALHDWNAADAFWCFVDKVVYG